MLHRRLADRTEELRCDSQRLYAASRTDPLTGAGNRLRLDEELRRVANTMRGHLRAADTVFRYGGEEFVVLLHEQPSAEAVRAMDRVRAEIERLAIPPDAGPLTISAGVAELDGSCPTAWIAAADEALYRAKANGRNRVET
jgi:diguanylate cyclase (GGDEF)-like protein